MQAKKPNQNVLKIILWVMLLMWMTWIFSLSAQNANESESLSGQTIRKAAEIVDPDFKELTQEEQTKIISSLQNVARKTAHLLLYLVLGVLCMTVLLQYSLKIKSRMLMAFLISSTYAATDEIHQLFVNGRGSQLSDVCIDALGALLGIFLFVLLQRICKNLAVRYAK